MSLQQLMGNHKFSGHIKVNISRDTNDRQLFVNANLVRNAVIDGDIVEQNSPAKIVRVVGEPVLPAKQPKCANEMETAEEGVANTIGAYEMEPLDDEPAPIEVQTKRKYRLPHFVAGKLKVPKEPAPVERLGVETIFPNVCFHFLNGHCIDDNNCLDSHTYPQQDDVFAKLQAIGWEKAAKLFRVIVPRCRGLLKNYFIVFAKFFAIKRQRGPLLDMLAVCEDPRHKIVEYLAKLIKAFMHTGLTYSQTIAIVLKHHRRVSSLTLKIIFNTDIVGDTSIADVLKGLELLNADPEFDFNIATINYLLVLSYEIGSPAIVRTMIKIFDRLRRRCPTAMTGIDQNAFKRFMDIYDSCTKEVTETSGRSRIHGPRK